VSIREVLRGIHHWATVHPAIYIEVSAYLVNAVLRRLARGQGDF
jgi:hypothetical protein